MKKNKKIILFSVIGGILLLILSIIAVILLNKNNNNNNNNNNNDEINYQNILDSYAEYVLTVINNYYNENGYIPTFEQIQNLIDYEEYNISCVASTVYYDGSLYLNSCSIDGVEYTYTYGKNINYSNFSTNGKLYLKDDYSFTDTINDNDIVLFEYECLTNFCGGYYNSFDANQDTVILFDGNNYLYNINTNESSILNIGKTYYSSIKNISDKNKIYGFSIEDQHNIKLYNYDLDMVIIEDKTCAGQSYSCGFYSTESLLKEGYVLELFEDKEKDYTSNYLINITTGEIITTIEDTRNITDLIINNKTLYTTTEGNTHYVMTNSKLYFDNSFNNYAESEISYNTNSNGTINIQNKTNYKTYDINGNILHESKEYKTVIGIKDNFVLICDEQNNIKLLDSNENEIKIVMTLKENEELKIYQSEWGNSCWDEEKQEFIIVIGSNSINRIRYNPYTDSLLTY